jgi:hypothetical protein
VIRHPVESIAYYNPLDKYVIRTHQGWSINAPMSPQGLRVYLVGQGYRFGLGGVLGELLRG